MRHAIANRDIPADQPLGHGLRFSGVLRRWMLLRPAIKPSSKAFRFGLGLADLDQPPNLLRSFT
jgi:hypothetical protein